jgi:hypothetical protein
MLFKIYVTNVIIIFLVVRAGLEPDTVQRRIKQPFQDLEPFPHYAHLTICDDSGSSSASPDVQCLCALPFVFCHYKPHLEITGEWILTVLFS